MLPNYSRPNNYGNTVLAGHRFSYSNNGSVFFNLDKVSVGELIYVYWKGLKYTYSITQIVVVGKDDKYILNNSSSNTLSVVTCTPWYNPTDRLIIIGKLVRID